MTLEPGLPVIFVGPDTPRWGVPSGLTVGSLYFVEEVIPRAACTSCLEPGRPLVALKDEPGNFKRYCACAFRPLGDGEAAAEVAGADAQVKVLVGVDGQPVAIGRSGK